MRGLEGDQKLRCKVSGIEEGWRGDHVEEEGCHQETVDCDEIAGIMSDKECKSTSTGDKDTFLVEAGEDLELQLSIREEEVGWCIE